MKMNSLRVFELNSFSDSRGTFTRTFNSGGENFLDFKVVQSNISSNPKKATLRGLHYQVSGPPEDKIICLVSGSAFMVVVDMRPDSPKFLQKVELELNSPMFESIYVPNGYATGWISTSNQTVFQYLMSSRYEECQYSGIRYDDASLSINWPIEPVLISEQDLSWPYLQNLEIR